MGGIKNKLTSKVKTLSSSLSLTERSDERSSSGEVKTNNKSKSSGFCHLIRQTSSATFPVKGKELGSPWARGAVSRRLTEGSLSAGLSLTILTKYLGIACLSLAILSTLILNIVSSYSASSTLSRAEPMTRNVGPVVTGPAKISLSITSSSSTSGSDLTLQIPRGGGIATGRHTVRIDTSTMGGFDLSLQSANEGSMLANADNSNYTIEPVDAQYPNYSSLGQNTWGYAITGWVWSMSATNGCTGPDDMMGIDGEQLVTQPKNDPTAFLKVSNQTTRIMSTVACKLASTTTTADRTINLDVNYGVRVDNPVALLAGNYTSDVVYTATVRPLGQPVIDSITPNTYELGSDAGLDSEDRLPVDIISSSPNLGSIYAAYLINNETQVSYDLSDAITNVDSLTDSNVTVTLPTDKTNPELEPGEYTIHVVTQGGEATASFTYTKKQLPEGILESTDGYGADGHVAVDYDENMIPITYTGNETTPKWVIADASNGNSDTNLNWYDYPNKKWANAVTLTEEGLSLYKGKPVGTEIDEQYVLGYWVYIPRYAYKVMRKEVADKVVTDEVAKNNGKGGFEIVFETNNDIVKEPAICNSSNANQYYQDCIKNQYGEAGIDYPGNNEDLKDKTAWATHPAFTWQYTQDINGFDKTYELNGIWVGKFETTGNDNAQRVLPNKNYANNKFNGKGIGHFFDLGKSLGVYDENNPYGNTEKISDTRQNNHNLSASYSHMAKNSEWGAAAYLSSSKYGSGIDGVLANASSSYTGRGSNEEKYQTNGGIKSSTTGTIYGIYDMSGGGYEIVAGGRTRSDFLPYTPKEEEYMMYLVRPPYINPYTFPSTKVTDPNKCSWESCGGHALHEVYNFQAITGQGSYAGMWSSGDIYHFIGSSYPWFIRGGSVHLGSTQSIYDSYMDNDKTYSADSFRAVLIAY